MLIFRDLTHTQFEIAPRPEHRPQEHRIPLHFHLGGEIRPPMEPFPQVCFFTKGIGTSTLKDKDKLTTSLAMSCHMHQNIIKRPSRLTWPKWAWIKVIRTKTNQNLYLKYDQLLIRILQKIMHSQAATVDFIHDFIHFSHIIPKKDPPMFQKRDSTVAAVASKISRSWGSISLGVGCRNLSSSDSKISAPTDDAPTGDLRSYR